MEHWLCPALTLGTGPCGAGMSASAQRRCAHPWQRQSRQGSNHWQNRVICLQCGKLLFIHWFRDCSESLIRLADTNGVEMTGAELNQRQQVRRNAPPPPPSPAPHSYGNHTPPEDVPMEPEMEPIYIPIEKVVERIVQVPVVTEVEKIVEVPIQIPVERIVEVERIVHVDREITVEVPVPQVVRIPAEVREKIVQVPVIEYVETPVETVKEVTVEVPRMVQVPQLVEVPTYVDLPVIERAVRGSQTEPPASNNMYVQTDLYMVQMDHVDGYEILASISRS